MQTASYALVLFFTQQFYFNRIRNRGEACSRTALIKCRQNIKKASGSRAAGHILALITIIIWGATFVATEYLLEFYSSTQLLFIRFAIAYIVLWAVYPKPLKISGIKNEFIYLLLSLSGITGYYSFENIAIKNGSATNTSILISFVPIITVIMMCITGKKSHLTLKHFAGFAVAIAGVCLVVYNGAKINLNLNLVCVACAFGACLCWGVYSLLVMSKSKINPVQLSRRTLFWALAFLAPYSLITDGVPSLAPLWNVNGIVSLILLGVFGSGLCYVMWNKALHTAGVEVVTNYVYLQPFVTMFTAIVLGREAFSVMGAAGAVLIVAGVLISDKAK